LAGWFLYSLKTFAPKNINNKTNLVKSDSTRGCLPLVELILLFFRQNNYFHGTKTQVNTITIDLYFMALAYIKPGQKAQKQKNFQLHWFRILDFILNVTSFSRNCISLCSPA
jgi:hypothetical protein